MYIKEIKVTGDSLYGRRWELYGYQQELIGDIKNIEAMVIEKDHQFLFDGALFTVASIEELEDETHYHLDEVRPAPMKLEV
ncbi:hypothetical protein QUF96_02895 [Bacillus bombysepticus]|nr:hypothetical protein [Bacillus bombysepticus]